MLSALQKQASHVILMVKMLLSKKRFLLLFVLLTTVALRLAGMTYAEDDLDQKKREIDELQKKLEEIQGEKQSLSQTINYLSTKIKLTESEISKTEVEIQRLEEQITTLVGKIDLLNVNLSKLSEIMVNRVNASYKNANTQPVFLLLVSDGFSDFFRRYKYLKVSQQHDREVMFALEEARTNYDTQKSVKEEKQIEVEELQKKLISQRTVVERQQKDKQAALNLTQNDERKYQQQLQKALAELEAIQSIIAGKGTETESGTVKEGDRIASVIPSSSPCSNGAHLHFEVAKAGVHLNPANYLTGKDVTWDNSPDGPFDFSGSWPWPINDPVRVTQGYGMTFYAATMRYYGGAPHTGIDMINKNNEHTVKAVRSGKLYRGSIACGGGALRYVRVEQEDGFDTYYLHVNY